MTRLVRIHRGIARCERFTAVVLLATAVSIVALQVFFRYALNNSLSWSEEAARYLFIWASLLGFSSCVESKRLFRFEMVAALLPSTGRKACAALYVCSAAAFVWVLIVNGSMLVWHTMSQVSPAMGLPMAVAYAALPVSGLLIGLHFLAQAAAPRSEATHDTLPSQ